MTQIITHPDPSGLGRGIETAGAALAKALGQRAQESRTQAQQRRHGTVLAQILGDLPEDASPMQVAQAFTHAIGHGVPIDTASKYASIYTTLQKADKKETFTPSQRAQQVNKLADSQRNLILNNFKGPLGEIRFTGKEGAAAKKALHQIEKTRQRKIKTIFGKEVPEEFQEEFTAADKFFEGKFMELPAPEPEGEKGFFSRWSEKLFGKRGKKSPSKGKSLTESDIDRIAKEVRQSNPGATSQQLTEIATKKAKDEGFEF